MVLKICLCSISVNKDELNLALLVFLQSYRFLPRFIDAYWAVSVNSGFLYQKLLQETLLV